MPRGLLHQGNAGALDRNVGARSHGDADFGLGERRRVVHAVPAIATAAGLGRAALSPRPLSSWGSTSALHFGDARASARTCAAVNPLSPVSISARMPSATSAWQCFRVTPDRVGYPDHSADLRSVNEKYHALPVSTQLFASSPPRGTARAIRRERSSPEIDALGRF